jgi:hypothetical protein
MLAQSGYELVRLLQSDRGRVERGEFDFFGCSLRRVATLVFATCAVLTPSMRCARTPVVAIRAGAAPALGRVAGEQTRLALDGVLDARRVQALDEPGEQIRLLLARTRTTTNAA